MLAEWICDHDLDCKDGSDEKVVTLLSETESQFLTTTLTRASLQDSWQTQGQKGPPKSPGRKHSAVQVPTSSCESQISKRLFIVGDLQVLGLDMT